MKYKYSRKETLSYACKCIDISYQIIKEHNPDFTPYVNAANEFAESALECGAYPREIDMLRLSLLLMINAVSANDHKYDNVFCEAYKYIIRTKKYLEKKSDFLVCLLYKLDI